MKYEIEELEHEMPWLGKKATLLISCTIQITEYFYTRAVSGVPYNGGQNLPEPSEPEEYSVKDWCFDDTDINIQIEFGNSDTDFSLNLKGLTPYRSFVIEIVRDIIEKNLDWDAVNEELTNYYGD